MSFIPKLFLTISFLSLSTTSVCWASNDTPSKVNEIQEDLKKMFVGTGYTFIPVSTHIIDEPQEIRDLRRKSMGGDSKSMYELAMRLNDMKQDDSTDMRRSEAFQLFSFLARKGHLKAMSMLAAYYRLGWGCEESGEKAIEWCRKAIARGNRVNDKLFLAKWLSEGVGPDKGSKAEKAEAITLLRQMAHENVLSAMYNLALFLFDGIGCAGDEKDQIESIGWARKASEKKHIPSMKFLAVRLLKSKAFVDPVTSQKEAFSLFSELVAMNDHHSSSALNLMKLYGIGCEYTEENRQAGLKGLQDEAAEGCAIAMYPLAIHYLRPYRGLADPNNAEQGLQLLRKATSMNDGISCLTLAACLHFGIGCKVDNKTLAEAQLNYTKAVGYQISGAHESLAYCLFFGIGDKVSEKNKELAYDGLNLHPGQNLPVGNILLAYMLAMGEGARYAPAEARRVLIKDMEHEMAPSIILYTYLREKKYQDALKFYKAAEGRNDALIKDELMCSYLQLKIDIEQAYPKHQKTVRKKKGAAVNLGHMEPNTIKEHAVKSLRYFMKLYPYVMMNCKIHGTKTSMGKRSWKQIEDLNKAYSIFDASFRKASDDIDRRAAANDFIAALSDISEELFIESFRNEFKSIQQMIEAELRDRFEETIVSMRGF